MPTRDLRTERGYIPYKPNRLERALDGALRLVAPQRALRNAFFREQIHAFGYEGARLGRARKNATRTGTITSNTPANSSDRLQLVWEARDLAMNDPFIHGMLDKFAHYVVGPRFRCEAITGNPGDDHMLEDWIYECAEHCDFTGRSRLSDFARLIVISVLRDGDFGLIHHEVPDPLLSALEGRPVGWLQLQACESDVIGGYHYWLEPGIVSGVEYDEQTGRVLGYRIYPRNNFGYYRSDYTRVPAEQFTFLSYRQRTDQYRGVSPLAAAIPTARDIKEILENEKFGVKWANSWAGFIKTSSGSADGSDPASVWQGNSGVSGTRATDPNSGEPIFYEDFHPGQVGYLGLNESIEAAKTDRPSSAFAGFLALLYRQVCTSIGMPFGFAFDATSLRGAVARLESMQAKRTFDWWQAYVDENFYQPTFRRWIAYGIITGRLRFSNLAVLPQLRVHVPAHPTMDVGRESAANLAEYEAGVRSFSSIVLEGGGNPREEIERMANDAQMKIDTAKRRGIPLQVLMPSMAAPEQKPAMPPSGGGSGGGGGSDAKSITST